jgi:hypothetical protein
MDLRGNCDKRGYGAHARFPNSVICSTRSRLVDATSKIPDRRLSDAELGFSQQQIEHDIFRPLGGQFTTYQSEKTWTRFPKSHCLRRCLELRN